MDTTTPSQIQLHKKSKTLELQFGDTSHHLSAEFLRVHSPSAEVQGHGPGQAVLQYGKAQVGIDKLEATGNYGIRIYFDDAHNTGIYSWELLKQFCENHDTMMAQYETALHQAGKSRQPDAQVLHFPPA